MDGTGGLARTDWVVLAGYLLLLVITGVWVARARPTSGADYFLGGRRIPAWAAAISVLATSLSAATFIGAPQQAYVSDLRYLSASIGALLAAGIVAAWFVPAFYRHGSTTIYGLLERRLGHGARQAAGVSFLIGRVGASGARLFIAALPASLILFGDTRPGQLVTTICVLTAIGIVYTLAGGVASVIWTDVAQTIVFVVAVVAAIVVLLSRIPADPGQIVAALEQGGAGGSSKLAVLSFSTDPAQTYTIWTALIAFTLFNVAAYGTDHDLAQRLMTCRSARRGGLSAVVAMLVGLPVVALFMVVGLLLYVFYENPGGVMGAAGAGSRPDDSRHVFLAFILAELPAGVTGLVTAGLLAAGLSSLNSALNAMSSVLVSDLSRRAPADPRRQVRLGRLGVIGAGVVLGGFACVCVFWQASAAQTLIDFALSVMTFAYAGLLAVFLTALFTRRGNSVTAVAALVTGFGTTVLLDPAVWGVVAELIGRGPGPAAALGEWMASVELAFPWRLVVATAVAMVVCSSVPSPPGPAPAAGTA